MPFAAVLPRHSAHRRRPAAAVGSLVLALLAALLIAPSAAHAADDTTAPELTSFTVSAPDPAAPNDQVTFDYAATDDQSTELRRLDVTLRTPLDGFVTLHTPTTGLEGATAHTILESWANGEYRLARVYIEDMAGNGLTYYSDGRAEVSPSGVSGPSAHTLDLVQTFRVSGSTADVSTPVLHSLRQASPDPVASGEEVVVDYEVSDATGLQEIELAYRAPVDGKLIYLREFDRAGLALRGQVRETVLDRYPNGRYELVAVRTVDRNSNQAEYRVDGTVVKTPSGATGVTRHSLDLSAGDFEVAGSTADTSAPQLTSFALRAPQPHAEAGDVVSVDYTATDDSGGLRTIQFSFVDPVDRQHSVRSLGTVAPLSGTVSVQVPPEWVDGRYTLRSIFLIDEHGNSSFLDGSGRVTKSPAGASGATTHGFDLAAVSFQVGVAAEDPQEREEPEEQGTAQPGTAPAARSIEGACPRDRVPPNRFVDVVTGSTHERAINCLVWWSVANGRTTTTYAPSAGVTRDAMAAFVARAILKAKPGSLQDQPADAFGDDNGSVHQLSINQLAAAGIVGGTGGGSYSPDKVVTRGQMSKFLANAARHVLGAPLPADREYFSDDATSPFQDDINRVAQAGLTGGRADGTFDPTGLVLRDQMGSFLARTLDLFVANGARLPA